MVVPGIRGQVLSAASCDRLERFRGSWRGFSPLAAQAALEQSGVTTFLARPSRRVPRITFYASAAALNSAELSPVPQQSGASAAIGGGTATIAQKGALLTAVASILLYHQNRSEVAVAERASRVPSIGALNQFLINDCTATSSGSQLCDGFLSNPASGEQVVNLWRAADFTGGLDVVAAHPHHRRRFGPGGSGRTCAVGALLSSLNGSLAGGHFVVATGINGDGSLAIQDSNPLFSQSNLNGYLNGFSSQGGAWKGTVSGAVRFAVRSPSATRFLLGAVSQPASLVSGLALSAASPAGACGASIQMLDTR